MSAKTDLEKLPFSQHSLNSAKSFTPNFESAIIQYRSAYRNQASKNRAYNETLKKARLYVSHFIQVLNFAILRGEMKPEVREFYGIDKKDKKVPSLTQETDLLEWGKKVIEGDRQRVMKGGSPIYCPSIAVVKTRYDQFDDAYHHQKMLQNITNRAAEKVSELRPASDEIILNIWNEVEEHYKDLPDEKRREKLKAWGVVYFYRPGEKKKLEADKLQGNLVFEEVQEF